MRDSIFHGAYDAQDAVRSVNGEQTNLWWIGYCALFSERSASLPITAETSPAIR